MTIQQLQYALAVYRAGSISAAAATLGLAQPNLSGTIRALEEELGYSIFLRNSKGVQPTEKGVEALSMAAQMVENYRKMTQLGSKPSAERLRIGGVSYAPVCDAFARLCREFQDQQDLEMSYFCDGPEIAMDKLLFASLDLVVVLQSTEGEEKLQRECRQKGIRITPIANIPIVLRIGPKHPLYGSGKTTVLVTRLGYMALCCGIDPARILAVTYTVAATRELRARFAARFPELAERFVKSKRKNG